MPKVELRLGEIRWPAKCCRCESTNFRHRTHTEKVVTKTVISASEYRQVSLQHVPICDRCAGAKYPWFAAAIVAAAIGMLILFFSRDERNVSSWIPVMFSLAVVLAIVATRKGPLKIQKYNEGRNSVDVNIYSRQVAAEMSLLEAARPASPEHAEYLELQLEKKRKQHRELVWSMRTIGLLGLLPGLYIVVQSKLTEGFGIVIFSIAIWLPFELQYRRSR